MDQYFKEWKVYSTLSVPSRIRKAASKDEFAQELLDLWDSREMKGVTYTAYLYSIPVGFILLQDNSPKYKTIRGTWVSENFRGRGVGEKLLSTVLQEYEHQDVDIVVNITPGAEGFYKKYGFKIVGHRDDFNMDIGLWESLKAKEDNDATDSLQH